MCQAIKQPDPRTVETYCNGVVTIDTWVSLDALNQFRAQLPNTGPDNLTLRWVHSTGEPRMQTFKTTFWATNTGWAFLSYNGLVQFIVYGVNGAFYDANAQAINGRNVWAGATPLLPCANAAGFGSVTLLPNQVRPQLFLYNGVYIPQPN